MRLWLSTIFDGYNTYLPIEMFTNGVVAKGTGPCNSLPVPYGKA